LNQILNPILSIIQFIGNTEDYNSIIKYFLSRQKEIRDDRKLSIEGMIFFIIKEKEGTRNISYSDILAEMRLLDYTSNLNPRKLGSLLKQFEIKTIRKNTGFMIDVTDNKEKLKQIYHTFDLTGDTQ